MREPACLSFSNLPAALSDLCFRFERLARSMGALNERLAALERHMTTPAGAKPKRMRALTTGSAGADVSWLIAQDLDTVYRVQWQSPCAQQPPDFTVSQIYCARELGYYRKCENRRVDTAYLSEFMPLSDAARLVRTYRRFAAGVIAYASLTYLDTNSSPPTRRRIHLSLEAPGALVGVIRPVPMKLKTKRRYKAL